MKDRYFLISVDTEGDDQWSWVPGKPVTTENALFLPRFQALCEKYGFIPTYLTDYLMAKDKRFVDFAKPKADSGLCEIGMHLHAWSSSPSYEFKGEINKGEGNCPYLIEYPVEVMDEKIAAVTKLLSDTFRSEILTHRAGRWAMDERYFSLLYKYGYKFDCSVTPGVNWKNSAGLTLGSGGSDYTGAKTREHIIGDILEIPMTVRRLHKMAPKRTGTPREALGRIHGYMAKKHEIWLRPNGKNLDDMLYLVDSCKKAGDPYIMFMIHSSELMPGGCWRFENEEKIEKLYSDMDKLFCHIKAEFKGISIANYGKQALK